jgi:hypothetical protein
VQPDTNSPCVIVSENNSCSASRGGWALPHLQKPSYFLNILVSEKVLNMFISKWHIKLNVLYCNRFSLNTGLFVAVCLNNLALSKLFTLENATWSSSYINTGLYIYIYTSIYIFLSNVQPCTLWCTGMCTYTFLSQIMFQFYIGNLIGLNEGLAVASSDSFPCLCHF